MLRGFALAKILAERGYRVFPLHGDSKFPVFTGRFADYATTDVKKLERMWFDPVMGDENYYDVAIATEVYRDKALLVLDADVSDKVNGLKVLKEKQVKIPKTAMQRTKRGGVHFVFSIPEAIKQGAGLLGPGLDTRSRGGFIVAYQALASDPTPAPKWLLDWIAESSHKSNSEYPSDASGCPENDVNLQTEVSEGGRASTAYKLAAKLKDFGNSKSEIYETMSSWNTNYCFPPLDNAELTKVIDSVFLYGLDEPGSRDPTKQFGAVEEEEPNDAEDLPDVIKEFNKKYAVTIEGGKLTILHETRDRDGTFQLERIGHDPFHQFYANVLVLNGPKSISASRLWMSHPRRRTYDRVVFAPGMEVRKNEYNLWKGFSVTPVGKDEEVTEAMQRGLDAFKEHLLENVCNNDKELAHWLTCYFAQMIQSPYEKPLVALVFKGRKGTGKDSLINSVGKLLGNHYVMAANNRYIMGNFNAHLEHCLFLGLNEAFWSGDKKAEGIIKDLITGHTHLIERKGKETVKAANYTRVAVLGNEDWLVPATMDERRFAVFTLGEKRMQDIEFFKGMRLDLEDGGYRLLLRYLKDYKITADVNRAPNTEGLAEQKIESAPTIVRWWYNCLREECIEGSLTYESKWPKHIRTKELHDAYLEFCRSHGIRSRLMPRDTFGKEMKILGLQRVRMMDDGERAYYYDLQDLEGLEFRLNKLLQRKGISDEKV